MGDWYQPSEIEEVPSAEVILRNAVERQSRMMEKLREEYAHRRLGFAIEEVVDWCATSGLKMLSTEIMRGTELDIAIWTASKE